jgi:hydroxyacyl-ACP dehydratase HTD2-like protein with hotdog domain
MFHVPLFWDIVELDHLSPDGVSIDSLLPKFPLEKAMAGGLKIEYHRDIFPGDWLTATRTLTDIYEKQGRSGPLIFYEVVMDVVNDDGELVIREKTTRILR